MQLKISFLVHDLILPVAYRQIVQGMLYRQLELQPQYAAWLHNTANVYEKRSFKLFTFSDLTGPFHYLRESRQLLFHDTVQLEVRSVDSRFIQILLASLPEGGTVTLNHQQAEIVSVQLENVQIHDSEIFIRTLTPIAAHITENGSYQKWFGPADPEFYSMVEHNADRRYHSFYHQKSAQTLHFGIADSSTCSKVVTTYKRTIVNAWNGTFRLSGDSQMLNFLYDCGLGERNAQGFGMFRVLTAEEQDRIQERSTANWRLFHGY